MHTCMHTLTHTCMHAHEQTNKRTFEVPAYNWVCWQCQRWRFTEIFSFAQPSHAKNTQVGLQLPPFPDLVSTTRSWAKGLSLAMSRVTSISHPKHKLMKQHTTKHQHVGSLWRASRPTTWRSTATGPHTHCACFYCSPDTNNLMLCKARQISKQFKWFPPVSMNRNGSMGHLFASVYVALIKLVKHVIWFTVWRIWLLAKAHVRDITVNRLV